MKARDDKWPCPLPECGGKTRVVDSRGKHRRRQCKDCGHRFNTREILVKENPAQQTIVAKSSDPAQSR